jgi:predicted transcriptional regulator
MGMYNINIQEITIIRSRRPAMKDVNQELQWLGGSLGLFNLRDKDKSCFRIFVELVKSAKAGQTLSSDELAARSNLSRGTVIHHLTKLMKAGIIVHERNTYILRVDSMRHLIDEIEKDLERTLSDLKEVAVQIDKELYS